MATIALTGAKGFLGWHTRVALRERDIAARRIILGRSFDHEAAARAVSGADRCIHLAGVNRSTDEEIREGNAYFARQLASAITSAAHPPRTVVYANSIQAGNGTVYGEAKAHAGELLATAAAQIGAGFVDIRLPNVFGEHGKPFYNSVTATFAHQLVVGAEPVLQRDRDLTLLHAQNAAELLLGFIPPDSQHDLEQRETVSGLLDRLRAMSSVYRRGEIPPLLTPFDRDLFNTYRSFTFPGWAPLSLTKNEDARGSYVEVLRAHGGTGQTSVSTTVPGAVRGQHFHRRKVERLVVLRGSALVRTRRLFESYVVDFGVSGDEPVALDMPTMWAHSIENLGDEDLITAFWSNALYDPEHPDTIQEPV
ncbi:polysaccharide biosynthesis C-terminal domain-containing protein [Gulosibacter molinativorax]|uniref:Capsular biosynthesis protein n=1 Tax=Gulosibacter molinativorax TaxID=256821 RepID=A0ABT7CAB1_9MICO|nr:NAD-dependent epimerase/dehydratase family protein [Gulosibacter molinativorax]MDJ1372094.1 capsular biosynthesis protein [Gulosibacter molinativorax]QUY62363.1 Putative capsular polysaccharide synthesis enzyme [Gulosibacter molinativorax]